MFKPGENLGSIRSFTDYTKQLKPKEIADLKPLTAQAQSDRPFCCLLQEIFLDSTGSHFGTPSKGIFLRELTGNSGVGPHPLEHLLFCLLRFVVACRMLSQHGVDSRRSEGMRARSKQCSEAKRIVGNVRDVERKSSPSTKEAS